jgi:hypothetical protein
MGDDPKKNKGADTTGETVGGLHRQAVTLLYFPPKPGDKHEVSTIPVGTQQLADNTLSPAEKIAHDIHDRQTAALTAAKEHDPAKADKELKAARDLADSSQRTADQLLAQFNQTKESTRQTLAKEFGLDPAKLTQQEIETKLKSGGLTPDKRQRLEQLAGLQKELHDIRNLRETPAITRAQAAYMKASGAMEAPETASPEEKLRVSQQNAAEAMTLLREAVRRDNDKELVSSPQFESVKSVVNKKYETFQIELAGTTLGALATAEHILQDPTAQNDPIKKAQADAQYEAAYSAASKLDLAYIAAHQDELGPHGKEQGRLEIQQVYDLRAAAVSHKAQMLLESGKFQDALPLMTKLQADVPGLATNENFQAQMLKAYVGNTDADLMKHQQAFHDIYFRQENHTLTEDEKKKKYSAALAELNASADIFGKRGDQMTRGLQTLQAEQARLASDLKGLDRRNLEQAERDFETQRINREMDAVKKQILLLNQGIANNKTSVADAAYFQGSCRYLLGDLYEANERFHFAQDNNSTYSKNEAFKLDDLIHATNWWSRHNWLKQGLIVVAGVTAGIVVGALLCETGPGGVVAGYATAAGIIDAGATTAVAIGVNSVLWGGVAGSLTTAGTTAAFGDQVTAGTFVRGAGLGAGGAAFNLVRMAFAPAVLAGTVPRVVAGMAAGGTYGVTSGVPGFVADKMDGASTKTAAENFGLNVLFSTGAGAFTPLSSFKANPGGIALTNAWRMRVMPNLTGAAPILVYPTIEGAVIQSGSSAIVDLTHQPVIPRADRTQQRHDFSKDTDVIEELADPTVAPPPKHRR